MSPASKPRGPDFLVIGAQRAGTTWLHRVLRQHPALWLPPVKELHYFDRLETTRTWLDAKERRRVKMKGLLSLDPWLFRYWFAARGDDWYAKLFQEAQQRGLVAGEITPAYAVLDEDVLRRIERLNPGVKLIFVMRDPVERAWSALNNALKKGVADAASIEDSIERARNPGSAARSAYADTIRRFESIFPAEQFYYCFFDELRDRPDALTASLLTFLGVDQSLAARIEMPHAVNVAAGSKPIPFEFSRELARDYLPSVNELCRRFDGPPQSWKARYETLIQDGDG